MDEEMHQQSTNEGVGCGMEDVPDAVLQNVMFPKMGPSELGALACCSRRMCGLATQDHLWRPLFNAHFNMSYLFRRYYNHVDCTDSAPPPRPWPSWHRAFCYHQSIRCSECNEHSPYVFTLLPSHVRLCERCELSNPKYSLVTELEAKTRYYLNDEELKNLPFKEMKIRKAFVYLFLRSSVEDLAHRKQVHVEGTENSGVTKGEENNVLFSEAASCSKSSSRMFVDCEGSFCNESDSAYQNESGYAGLATLDQPNKTPKTAMNREDLKAKRKMHKQQVKAENRNRRMQQVTGREYHHKKDAINSSTYCSPSMDVEGTITSLQADGIPKTKSKHRSKREHVAGASLDPYRGYSFLGYSSQLKTKSPSVWVKEREWLEAELGQNGISALELAHNDTPN